MNLVDKDDILKDIADLQKSPWYNEGAEPKDGQHGLYLIRKEAVEIVRDMCVKVAPIVDAIPVEWIEHFRQEAILNGDGLGRDMLDWLLGAWQKEKEAR